MNTETKRITILGGFHQGFHWFSVGLLIPVITLLQLEKGLDLIQVGVASAAYSITVLILELPTGSLADTIGRKRIYILSRIFQLLTGALLFTAGGFPLVMAGFIAMGISRALSSGSMDAYFIDALEMAGRGMDLQKPLAIMGMFAPAGLAAGSLLGGRLPMTLGAVLVRYGISDRFGANIAVAVVCTILQVIFTLLVVREESLPVAARSANRDNGFGSVLAGGLKQALTSKPLLILLSATLAWGIAFSGLERFWQPRVKTILGNPENTMIFGLLSTGYFGVGVIGNLMSIPLSKWLGNNHGRTMVILRILMGGFFILLYRASGIGGFSVFYLGAFLVNGISNSPHAAMFNKIVPSGKRATILSLESLFLQAGGALGALYSGFVAESLSIGHTWLIGGVVLMVSSLLYIPFRNVNKVREVAA